jgi:ATP-binding cassette subfamily B protein
MTAQSTANGQPPGQRHKIERDMIDRYTDQPVALPDSLRTAIEGSWSGSQIQIYALADLDESLKLTEQWIAVGETEFALGWMEGGQAVVESFLRDAVTGVREIPGLSCTTLHILGVEGQPPLVTLRYSHRQRRALGNVKFMLEKRAEADELEHDHPDQVYASAMTQAVREAQASVAGHHFVVIWRLMSYLKPYRMRMTFGMIAAALMTLMALLPPYLTGYVIDHVIRPFSDGALTHEKALALGWTVVGGLAATYVFRELCLWVRLWSMSVLGEYVARDLRKELYAHLQRLSLNFYSSKQTGSIISRVSSDTDRLWDFVAFGIVEVSLAAIMLIGLSIVLVSLDWMLGLIMILPVPLLLYSFFIHGRKMKRIFLRAWRKWTTVTEVLSDTIPGMRVVKAFNQEVYETSRFNSRNDNAVREFNGIHAVWTRFWPGLMLGLHTMTVTVWGVAMYRVLGTPESAYHLSVGTFMAFLLYMGMFFHPIETIGMITRMMNRATSSALRIFEVLDTEPEIVDDPDAKPIGTVSGQVEFNNVSFAYDSIRPVIHNVSFKVEPGEMIGLVGPSGAGKTTITNLLVRFYDVSSGRILIDGIDLRELDSGQFRRQVGMVLQDPHLFHGSILDNIRYGQLDAELDAVVAAAQAANAHDFITKLPHGYDTIVGERGHTLSGGERQRVSIARAILGNPRILVLDEATSSVDTETERKIQSALERLIEGRTVFAIAHRLSTLRRADRLIVMKDGRIAEIGTHAELLDKEDGIYRKLHDLQQELHHMYAV